MIRSPISKNDDDLIFKKPYAKENVKTNHSNNEMYRDSERLNNLDLLIGIYFKFNWLKSIFWPKSYLKKKNFLDNIDDVLKGDCLFKNKTFVSSPLKIAEEKDFLKCNIFLHTW